METIEFDMIIQNNENQWCCDASWVFQWLIQFSQAFDLFSILSIQRLQIFRHRSYNQLAPINKIFTVFIIIFKKVGQLERTQHTSFIECMINCSTFWTWPLCASVTVQRSICFFAFWTAIIGMPMVAHLITNGPDKW